MKSPIVNPIRFYNPNNTPDYLTIFPNIDNVTFGEPYIYGVNSSDQFIRWHTGILYLQFKKEFSDDLDILLYKYIDNEFELFDTITAVDISPTGWTGSKILQLEADLDDGIYYFVVNKSTYPVTITLTSDIFFVTTDTERTTDLIKIKYSNSSNDFGCIFGAYYFESYFIGQLLAGDPKNEFSMYESDRGTPVKLRSTPVRTATLNIKGAHYTYLDYFNHLFSCDTIEINGVGYTNSDTPQWNPIDGGDLGDITIKLTQTANTYYNG